jgi:hypothetical protein
MSNTLETVPYCRSRERDDGRRPRRHRTWAREVRCGEGGVEAWKVARDLVQMWRRVRAGLDDAATSRACTGLETVELLLRGAGVAARSYAARSHAARSYRSHLSDVPGDPANWRAVDRWAAGLLKPAMRQAP